MDIPAVLGKRIGILGGTFDPVHNGHLAAAELVERAAGLDALVLIPSAQPPHKPGYRLTDFGHRAAMLDIAVAPRTGWFVSRLEAERVGPSFSIDTLRALRQWLGSGVEFFFVIGLDAFVDIASWKEYHRLPQLANFAVLNRPGNAPHRLAEVIAVAFPDYRYDPNRQAWIGAGGAGRIELLAMEPVAVSATRIREMVRIGQPVADLVPPGVAEYIRQHGLYRNSGAA